MYACIKITGMPLKTEASKYYQTYLWQAQLQENKSPKP